MRRAASWRRRVLLALCYVAAGAAFAQDVASIAPSTLPAPVAGEVPPTPEAGRRAYGSYCLRCHGINLAVGSSAYFDLRTFPKDDKARFLFSVTNGKRQMPAWGGIVQPQEMEAIWAYIGSVNGW